MILPTKDQKIQQENFKSYAEMKDFMLSSGFKNKGYVTEEPYKECFIERWEKNDLIAFSMNLFNFQNFLTLPLSVLDKPYQVDIAIVS